MAGAEMFCRMLESRGEAREGMAEHGPWYGGPRRSAASTALGELGFKVRWRRLGNGLLCGAVGIIGIRIAKRAAL